MRNDKYARARLVFQLFFLKSGESVTVDEICKYTGWTDQTVKTYYRKKWSPNGILKEVSSDCFAVRVVAELTEEIFIKLHSQIDAPQSFDEY
ncbi:hypothetical protein [Vibrio splendidus]|uniref:hypothetical protein n=1 Tax=Vibrio splendidus TaxID=29497 RepID=UPI00148E13DC|nr:hypothetical protein [Vibrio splendidus]NOJ09381.1 hypothetical protein [Vibrio splendidus]